MFIKKENAVVEVTDAIGACLVRARKATIAPMPSTFVSDFYARLDDGANQTCLFEPFIGEFGHLIMSHIRLVHFHKAKFKIICCRKGEECLFPSADEFITDWQDPVDDASRVATMRREKYKWPAIEAEYPNIKRIEAGGLSPTQELIAIHPEQRIPFRPKLRGLKVDVCLGVRHRLFAPERNWQHWDRLANALDDEGYTLGVIGRKETAPDLKAQIYHSGDFDTDAAIELIQGCKIYVGSDCGQSHLASTAGATMLTFREEASGSRNLFTRMNLVNNQTMTVVEDGWENPDRVIQQALNILREM